MTEAVLPAPRIDDDIDLPIANDNQIVFFDGMCGLCDRFVDFLLRADQKHHLRFAPLQGLTARHVLQVRYTLDLNTIVYFKDGTAFQFSDAAIRCLADLGGWWRLTQALLLVPRFLRDAVYRWVARRRYAWFGKREHCRLATPAEQNAVLP